MWRAPLLVSAALIALLGLGQSSFAAIVPAPLPPVFLSEEEEEEAEAIEAEEAEAEWCEEEPAECEEAEGSAKRGKGTQSEVPASCLLRSATARAVARASSGNIRLTVGYTTHEPIDVTVEARKGPVRLGPVRRHLGRSGVIRLSERVSNSQMDKAQSGGRLTVRLDVAGAPPSCRRFETHRLSVKRRTSSQTVWSEDR